MLANPADLVVGRGDTSSDTISGIAAIQRYNKGEIKPPIVSNIGSSSSEN
jgi:hypothetical protein